MTRREDIEQRCPEKVGEQYDGGVYGCPVEAGYKGKEECSIIGVARLLVQSREEQLAMCRRCWDMEAVR